MADPLSRSGREFACFRVGYRYGWAWALLVAVAGCTRTHYRLRADADTYAVLEQKTAATPWALSPRFSVWPRPDSRFYDPTPPDDPLLPIPAPQLYAYRLGELPQRDSTRFRPRAGDADPSAEEVPPGALASTSDSIHFGGGTIVQAGYLQEVTPAERDAPPPAEGSYELPAPANVAEQGELRVVPVPPSFWESIPAPCLVRMLEFSSVREEYRRTFGEAPPDRLRDPSPRLALEDIVDLAQVNNRAYQRQKEILYTAALRLTQERYAYQLKFSATDNGSDVDFTHSRRGGVTDDTLFIPTRTTVDKVLATGGDLLARFANDVVLTFNGPDGLAADIGSEMLLGISQSVLQRDIVLEALTQAERNVVYAARDFARFRKQLFRDLAAQYYNLLLAYRDIEISTQNYFSNVRGFAQAEAEYRADRLPRIQVDQFEQDALRGRSRLIAQCTSLEGDLDDLKFLIGMPPETAINLDLTELEQLSLRDEAVVAGELVRRAQRNLTTELEQEMPDQLVLVSGAAVLVDRLISWTRLQQALGAERGPDLDELEVIARRLSAQGARLQVQFDRRALETLAGQVGASPPLVYQRTMELIDSMLILAAQQLALALEDDTDPAEVSDLRRRLGMLRARYNEIRTELGETMGAEELPELIRMADELHAEAADLVKATDELVGYVALDPDEQIEVTRRTVRQLLEQARQSLAQTAGGLTPIEIDMDQAMLTALVQRFDLMNQRGALADAWRQIKLAGDDLRSVLNLNATQIVRTRSDVNRPFDFTWDDSQTRLALSFDAPLNRRAQRNAFRQSLINYQFALRNLIALEDSVKLAVRDDLRQLQLDREQYTIAVASAALAFERVVSTRLELSLGRQNVTARDVLESQAAYTASLSTVASEHIGYILDRIELFLNLELLQVDQSGFWPRVYDEDYQPAANLVPPVPARPYGGLPPQVRPSRSIRRMLWVPWGSPGAVGPPPRRTSEEAPAAEEAIATDLPPDEP